MNNFKRKIGLVVAGAVLSLTGCAHKDRVEAQFEKTKKEYEKTKAYRDDLTSLKYGGITTEIYVPPLEDSEISKPTWWFDKVGLFKFRSIAFHDAVDKLLKERNINARMALDVNKNVKISIDADGTIGNVIEDISKASGYWYRIDGNSVYWQNFKTATFDIAYLPGQQKSSLGNSGGNSGGNSSGSSGGGKEIKGTLGQQNSSFESISLNIDMAKILQDELDSFKSEEGVVKVNPGLMTVFVRDKPDIVNEIGRHVKKFNSQRTLQVAVDMMIISVELTDSESHGVNWDLVRKTITDETWGFASNFAQSVAQTTAPTLISYQTLNPSSKFQGSSAFFRALQAQGSVNVKTIPRVVTLSGHMSELIDVDQTTYVASATVSTVANVGQQTTMQEGRVTTGLQLRVLPKVVGDKVLMRVSNKISALKGPIERQQAGDSFIQTPALAETGLENYIMVPAGKSLLIGGLRRQREETVNETTGGSEWLGGEIGRNNRAVETIIIMTPTVIRG